MATTVGVNEWAPLWAIPVVPVPAGTVPAEAVKQYYPGDTTHFTVHWYRSVRAVLLVPTTASPGEASLPVPLLALVALSSGGRGRGRRDRVYQFSTSRGYDFYRLTRGHLREIWTGPEPVALAREIPLPTTARQMRRLRPRTAPPNGRRNRLSRVNTATAVLLVLALALRVTGNAGDVTPTAPAGGTHDPSRPVATVNLYATAAAVEQIVGAIPEVRLQSLRVDQHKATLRLWSPFAVEQTLAVLEDHLTGGTRQRWSVQEDEIILEIAYE